MNWVVPEIITKGRIERPTLGIEQVAAQRYFRDVEGSLITRVTRGSGAERAGLRGTYRDRSGRLVVGDVIVAIDDTPIRTSDDLLLALERRREGEIVRVTILRDLSEQLTVEVRLGPPNR